MTVSRATTGANQLAENDPLGAPEEDARALLGHLQSALAMETEVAADSEDSSLSAKELAAQEIPSFGRAVARQADQIQQLIEQINRLEGDTQVAELRGLVRDLYGTLNDVVLRVKQNASDVSAQIGLLTGAVTLISGADANSAPDPAAILDGAVAAAERMLLLERLQKDASSAITALQETADHAQKAVLDLSAGIAKLSEQAETDRNETANLHRRIETANQALAQKLAGMESTIESGSSEILRLHQRIELTGQASNEAATTLAERAAAMRDEMERLDERLGSVESTAAEHGGFREKIEVLNRRLEDAEHKIAAEINDWKAKDAERLVALANRLEAQERKNQILSQDNEQMAARLQAMEQAIATMAQSQNALSTWQNRLAQVLAGPQLPAV